jgi:hypothetical protein
MIDTGFDYKQRLVFAKMVVLAEYDFHWNDSNTANETVDPTIQHNHGTETLSVIGGFLEGNLIGPAYGATYALAKTEWVATETHIEEDHWVAGIEWLEGLGADVVSSSLAYSTFDDGNNYTYEDMDGNTAVTTIAADIAAYKGVVVVNSAGNEGNSPWRYILAPADGDSVITAGAVSSSGLRVGFSSVGPTYDGRIKPDVMAMGSGVYSVDPTQTSGYIYVSGTSFSCPLIAGVCALVLEAHPELGPMDVRDAIRETADQTDFPDNFNGWGIVNAYKAIFYHGLIFTHIQKVTLPMENVEQIEVDILSDNGIQTDSVFLYYRFSEQEPFQQISLKPIHYPQSPKFVAQLPSTIDFSQITFYIEAMDTLNTVHRGPIFAPDKLYSFSDTTSQNILLPFNTPNEIVLYPNYPNPFNSSTNILFTLSKPAKVSLKIFDMLGREIVTLVDRNLQPGKIQVMWEGLDSSGQIVPSGIYMYRLQVDSKIRTRKMVFVK